MKSRKVDGQKLRELRERRGFSGQAFADLVSEKLPKPVSKSHVWKIETGLREPSGLVFAAICSVLEIDDDERLLLPDESPSGVPA